MMFQNDKGYVLTPNKLSVIPMLVAQMENLNDIRNNLVGKNNNNSNKLAIESLEKCIISISDHIQSICKGVE